MVRVAWCSTLKLSHITGDLQLEDSVKLWYWFNTMVESNSESVIQLPLTDQPRIRTATRAPLDDRRFSHRYLGDHHALHLHDYHGAIRLGSKGYELQPGDITLTPAGVPSSYDLPRAGTHLVIHFHSGQAATGGEIARLPLHQSLGDQQTEAEVRLRRIIQMHAMARESRLARAGASTALQSLLIWLAMRSEHEPATGGSTIDRALQSAVDLIDRNLTRRLSVEQLSEQVGLSQNYLARRFRERFGMTMQQYATDRRVELARELITSTDLPIKTIGRRVGIPDPQYFNKLIRRATGQSPTAMRQGGSATRPSP